MADGLGHLWVQVPCGVCLIGAVFSHTIVPPVFRRGVVGSPFKGCADVNSLWNVLFRGICVGPDRFLGKTCGMAIAFYQGRADRQWHVV